MPASSFRVVAFARDRSLHKVLAQGLSAQSPELVRGTFPAMVRSLGTGRPPDLVIADLAGDLRPLPDRVLAIRALLPPACPLIAIPEGGDAGQFQACYHVGAADCLPRPVTSALVREAVAPFLPDASAIPLRERPGRVVVLTGSHGVGLASLAIQLSTRLAESGESVVCADFDPVTSRLPLLAEASHGPALDATLLLLETKLTLASEAGEPVPVPEIDPRLIVPTRAGYGLVGYPPPSSIPDPPPEPSSVRALLDGLCAHAHIVLAVSLPDPELRTAAIEGADTVLIAFEPAACSLGVATHILGSMAEPGRSVLLQCHPRGKARMRASDVSFALAGRKPDIVLPYDAKLAASGSAPPAPGSAYRKALDRVAAAVVGLPSPAP